MASSTVFLEKFVTENVKKPFRGDKVFFSTFPAHDEDRNRIGRFPFKVTVACALRRTATDRYTPLDAAPYKVLLKAIHAMGITVHWLGGAAGYMTPTKQQRDQFKRYSTHQSKKFPVVVNIETVLPSDAAKTEQFRISESDIIRLWGVCSVLSYQDLFVSPDKIKSMFPITACRMFKPGLKPLEVTRMFYSSLGNEYSETKIEDIPFDDAIEAVFRRIHKELKVYREGKKFDAFTDYVFDIIKTLARSVSNDAKVPVRLCPVCLYRVPESSRPERIYYTPRGYPPLRSRRSADPKIHREKLADRLQKMNLDQLREKARKRGVKFHSKVKKLDLVNLLLDQPSSRRLDYCQRSGPRLESSSKLRRESQIFRDALIGR